MQTKEFLTRVLPPGGDYIGIINKKQSTQFTHRTLPDFDNLDQFVGRASEQTANVYYATGTFTEKREAGRAKLKKSFYLDLDCGEGKGYASKKVAVRSLFEWCDAQYFPRPNVMVDSGHGVHAYWVLGDAITASLWVTIATRFKDLCINTGLVADHAITADVARIMRCPGTVNWKGQPAPVRVFYSTPEDLALTDITAALGNAGVDDRLAGLGEDDDLTAGVGAYEMDQRPRYASRMLSRCNILKHTYETGGEGQAEPLWMQQLHLLAYCEDGSEFIHVISESHESYDYQRTEKKYKQRVAKKDEIGPTLCKTLGGYFPEKCQSCRFNGHIKTPLQLGIEETNELPFGFQLTDKGIFRAVQVMNKDTGSMETEYIPVFPERIADFKVFCPSQHEQGKSEHTVRFTLPDTQNVPTVEFSLSAMNDTLSLSKALSAGCVLLSAEEAKGFRVLMNAWVRKMKDARLINERVERMGWSTDTSKGVGFALAKGLHWPDGTTEEVAFPDRNMSSVYVPRGERAFQLGVLRDVTAQGRPAITAAVMSAFAAPLIRFTGVPGALLSIVSPRSGTGKSAALRIAQSVWGCPVRGVNALNDTPLSVARKLGFTNSLPAYWDELRMKEDVTKFIKLVFQLGQGKERSRLTATADAQTVGTWQTLMTVASNESVYDHVTAQVSNTNAGALRVFEVTVKGAPPADTDIPYRVSRLDENYGWLGVEYASWLVQNHDTVEALVLATQKKMMAKLEATADERFWVAVMTSLYVAAALAVKLGFAVIDLPGFMAWLSAEFKQMRHQFRDDFFESDSEQALQLLLEYADSNREQFVVCDHLSGPGRGPGVCHTATQIRGEVYGQLAIKDKAVRIHRGRFRDWLYHKKDTTPLHIIRSLVEMGAAERRTNIYVGVGHTIGARTRCIDMQMDTEVFDGMLEHFDLDDPDLGV